MSFGFFGDAALTTPLDSLITTHDPATPSATYTRALWFGSTDATKKVQAASNPGVDPIVVTVPSLLTAWAASTPCSLAAERIPTTPNNRVYRVTTAGTSGASQPTWPTTVGATVADGSVTWTCVAHQDEPAEYRLALTEDGLASASPGAGLSLGVTILGGVGNAVPFFLRAQDADGVDQTATHVRLFVGTMRRSAV